MDYDESQVYERCGPLLKQAIEDRLQRDARQAASEGRTRMGQTIIRCLTAAVIAAIICFSVSMVLIDLDTHAFEYNMALLRAEQGLFDSAPGKGM